MRYRSVGLPALFLLGTALPVAGQALGRYQASPDTIRYASLNSYLLYFVRGRDTLGSPVTTQTAEFRVASGKADGLEFWVRLKGEGPSPFDFAETYLVNPSGRVLKVGGQAVADAPSARVDLLPRWPSPPSQPTAGQHWKDTVSVQGTQPFGQTFYRAERNFRVLRVCDSLGTTLAQLVASGTIHLRQGGWANEAQKQAWWQEVTGPVVDSVWFDVRHGNIVASVAAMDLVGTGGSSGGPVMPSGLRSTIQLTRQ